MSMLPDSSVVVSSRISATTMTCGITNPTVPEYGSAIEADRLHDVSEDQTKQVDIPSAALPSREKSSLTDVDFMIDFGENDLDNPHNWPLLKRGVITICAAVIVLNCTIASAIPSGVLPQIQGHFGFSHEIGALCVSLFVLGFAVGPIVWGPMSEDFGRRPVSLISFPLFIGTQIGCALSPSTASILIFRFLGGVFGAAYLTNSGAIITDLFSGGLRGKALSAFAFVPFAGPSLAPIISGWMSVAGVNWAWAFWLQAIYGSTCLLLVIIAQPETYKPVLLVHKARRKRQETADDRWWAPLERRQCSPLRRARLILTRTFQMLITEPMLLALTIYLSFAYGIIYLLLEAYPIVFTVGYHFNTGLSGLVYLPVPIGGLVACIIYFLHFNPKYLHEVKRHDPLPPPPECRLPVSLYGSILLPISLFWFAWASNPGISYWAPMMAGLPLGLAVVLLYLGLYSYMFDVYTSTAASALAATIITRSFFGAGFPLFATQMYEKLTPRWASTLLAFISLAMAPLPFVLQKFGPTLRARSRNAPEGQLADPF